MLLPNVSDILVVPAEMGEELLGLEDRASPEASTQRKSTLTPSLGIKGVKASKRSPFRSREAIQSRLIAACSGKRCPVASMRNCSPSSSSTPSTLPAACCTSMRNTAPS
jgi:hypothetical protein